MFDKLHHGLVTVAMHHIARNDIAHRTDHVMQVANNAMLVAKRFDLDRTTMLLAALLHDIYSGRDRVNHHLLAAEWVRNNLGKYGYDERTVADVATMCEEHRDSGDGAYSSLISEAFAAADRGPIAIVDSVERAFGKNLSNIDQADITARWPSIIKMLRNKFDVGGYACHNVVHEKVYAAQNSMFRAHLQRSSDDEILKYVLAAGKHMNFKWRFEDEIAHNDMYVINDGLVVRYDSELELFDDLEGPAIEAHRVTRVLGMLQINPNNYQGA